MNGPDDTEGHAGGNAGGNDNVDGNVGGTAGGNVGGSAGMGDHVDAVVRELVFGILPETDAESAWAHLAECEECAGTVRAARSLYETALGDGSAHVAAEKLVLHAESSAPLSRIERLHLERCGDCRADLDILGRMPAIEDVDLAAKAAGNTAEEGALGGGDSIDDGRTEPRMLHDQIGPAPVDTESGGNRGDTFPRRPPLERQSRTRRWFQTWRFRTAAALVAATLAILLPLHRGQIDTVGLVPIVPVDVRLPRGGADPGSFDAAWLAALGDYAGARYEAAETGLKTALALDPQHAESWLLLGSSLLLQGRLDEAAPAFESALQFAPNRAVREEAEWQAIVARLARGSLSEREFSELESEVRTLAQGSGPRAASAGELEERLRTR